MKGKLCLLCCRDFSADIESAVAAEGWTDLVVAAFPAPCGHPPVAWDELRPLVAEGCTGVVILRCGCLEDPGSPPDDWPPVWQIHQADCFHLVGGVTATETRGARAIGGDLTLIRPDSVDGPGGMAGRSATRMHVGTDCVPPLLGRVVAEWRLWEGHVRAREAERDHARELADHKSAMDFLGRLPLVTDERETIAAIEEMFHLLFAPQVFCYVRLRSDGSCEATDSGEALSPGLWRQVQGLESDWSWTEEETGFLLRISRADEPLGVVVVDRFAFPEYRNRYLNLALSVAGVAGLAIDNARTYHRFKETEEELRKRERSLRMAQAMARLGHWELDVSTGEIRWSEEACRILGCEPDRFPGYDAFLEAVHPEDRDGVAHQIEGARDGGSFDIEFRVSLPDGTVRDLHGMGEVILVGPDMQPQMIGAIRDVTPPGRTELLGVIQDITERKQLQNRLEQEARTDVLTGCANRRFFLEQAGRELARARRYGSDVSVLMLDLDHFKKVNDRYGHAVGDLVLQTLVQVCQATLRQEDIVGRLGGEEFAIVLPETGREKALDVAGRLCLAVAAAEVAVDSAVDAASHGDVQGGADGNPPIRFTTSIGVATLCDEDFGMGAVLRRADRALYEAKRAGRNRVVGA